MRAFHRLRGSLELLKLSEIAGQCLGSLQGEGVSPQPSRRHAQKSASEMG